MSKEKKIMKLTTRQWRLYELLVAVAEANEKRWVNKVEIAEFVNLYVDDKYYINESETTHDICSTINMDRIAINNSLEVDKIILIKNNEFKIATEEEAIKLEQELHNQAMKLLTRKSTLEAKRLRNNQGKILSNQLKPIDDKSKAQPFHEAFVE